MGTEQPKKESPRRKKKPYTGLCHEIAAIAAIIGDAYLKQIHAQIPGGFIDAVDIVSEATVDFYKTYQKQIENPKTKWEDVLYPHQVPCYDDLVMMHAGKFIIHKHSISLKI